MQTTTVKRSGIKASGLLIAFQVSIICLIFSCSAAAKEGPLLDGKSFTVITMPNGNPAEAALETISFATGNFDNDNCHLWGFGNGAYSATEAGDSITFTATTTSAKEGTMAWKGTVKGNSLNGTMTWSKQGQDDLAYTFSSDNIEAVDLNGKSFDVQFTLGDSSEAEVITFNNGIFESPGCYAWGFTASPYQAYMLDGKPHFQSVYRSDKEGTMLFYGVIDGNSISGTQFWTKAGQDDTYYAISGQAH
jgi:hypothetical protein